MKALDVYRETVIITHSLRKKHLYSRYVRLADREEKPVKTEIGKGKRKKKKKKSVVQLKMSIS